MSTKVRGMSTQWPWRSWWRYIARVNRREIWLVVVGVVLVMVGARWLGEPFADLMLRAERTRDWILTFGPLAPLVYIGLFSTQILLAPVPGHFMAVMGGYLFGAPLGTLYSLAGVMLGAGVAMWLARRFGRPWLERFFDPVQLSRWERKLRTRSPLTWWVLFLFPVPDLVFYAAGLSSVPLRKLMVALVLGRGLGLMIATSVGHMTSLSSPEWVLVKWAVIGLVGALVYIYQRRIRLALLLALRRSRRWRRAYLPAWIEGA